MRTWILAATACLLTAGSARADETPVLKMETLGTPVTTARMWCSGLAPNPRGGWTFVGQFMNFSSTGKKPKHKVDLGDGRHYLAYDNLQERPEAEWLVADLDAGTYKIVNWPGFTSHAMARVLAENGRLFFGVDYAQIYYYEPAADTVKPLGRLKDDILQLRTFYQMRLGPDGMVYLTSQSTNGLATLVRINPDTLDFKLYEKIGIPGRRADLTYGYTLALDPPWMYVAVGQGNWEVFAVNADTGEKKCLADVTGDGCRTSVSAGADVCTAEVIKSGRKEVLWLVDGKAYPAVAGQTPPGTPMSQKTYKHVEWKNTRPMDIAHPPELDPAWRVEAGGKGEGEIHWRAAGSKDEYKPLKFAIRNAEPVRIESLIALPDGSLLGNTYSYNGFFRYYPETKKLDYFGKHGPSRVQSVWCEGRVWFDGYPNTGLWSYDPTQPWTSLYTKNARDAKTNPQMISSFGQGVTEAHYCRFLLAPGNGRLYICGWRERWSTGTGLGYYEVGTGKKFGLGTANKDIHPAGFVALPKLNRLVLSGEPLERGEPQFIVYDLDLKEIERIAVKDGLPGPGLLFNGPVESQFIGVCPGTAADSWTIYIYDLAAKKVVKSAPVASKPVSVMRRPADGSWWLILQDAVCKLDPASLAATSVGKLPAGLADPVWVGRELYGNHGGELVRVELPR